MSFFIRSRGSAPRGGAKRGIISRPKVKQTKKTKVDEEISTDSDEQSDDERKDKGYESDQNAEESAQDKRIRLAKKYLEEIAKEEGERKEQLQLDRDPIAHRLKEDVLEESGKLRKAVADLFKGADSNGTVTLRCKEHKLSITCVRISSDNLFIYSSSKDGSIVKWSMAEKKKIASVTRKKNDEKTHQGSVLSLAVTNDNKYVASGDDKNVIFIWSSDLKFVRHFRGHKGPVSGLVFRMNSLQLFSCSHDKSVKIWDLNEMAYVETLFGHQDKVTSIDCLLKEKALTSGGRDQTLRIWKIVEESQLIYNYSNHVQAVGSIDMAHFINDQYFVSAGDDGVISLWNALKKKPLHNVPNAHGVNSSGSNWISALATSHNTDYLASGSCNGEVCLWKCSIETNRLLPRFTVSVSGFVNSLAFTSDCSSLVIGVGQEHKLGRWFTFKEARNSVVVVPLLRKKSS